MTLGLAAGAFVFYAGDLVIDRMGGEGRKSCTRSPSEGLETALLLGAVLDGIPESAVIGISLLAGEGIGLPIVAAVFLSNVPEGKTVGLVTALGFAAAFALSMLE